MSVKTIVKHTWKFFVDIGNRSLTKHTQLKIDLVAFYRAVNHIPWSSSRSRTNFHESFISWHWWEVLKVLWMKSITLIHLTAIQFAGLHDNRQQRRLCDTAKSSRKGFAWYIASFHSIFRSSPLCGVGIFKGLDWGKKRLVSGPWVGLFLCQSDCCVAAYVRLLVFHILSSGILMTLQVGLYLDYVKRQQFRVNRRVIS